MNFGESESIGTDDMIHECNETVHVLSGSYTCTLALISFPYCDLFPPCLLAVSPKRLDSLASFLFVVDKVNGHSTNSYQLSVLSFIRPTRSSALRL